MSAIEKHNASVLADLEPGDLIEFERGWYSHWAVYKGHGQVIHLAGEEDDGLNIRPEHVFTIGGKMFNKAVIKLDNFWDVVAGCKAKKNNKKDSKHRCYSAYEIVERALSKVGKVGYNIITSNCEHFASWCRYDIERSDQVDSFLGGLALGVAAVGVGMLAYAMSSGGEEKEKKKKQTY